MTNKRRIDLPNGDFTFERDVKFNDITRNGDVVVKTGRLVNVNKDWIAEINTGWNEPLYKPYHSLSSLLIKYGLTSNQNRVLRFIEGYIDRNEGVPPSFREMSAEFGINIGKVHTIIKALEDRGHIRTLPGKRRSISIIKD